MTLKLYGVGISNYKRLIKALLIEKGLAFEEVSAFPSQKPEFLEISPMGKLPVLQVGDQYLTETLAISAYLDRIAPDPAWLPEDDFQAAKVMELVCHVKMDVELTARPLIPEVYFNKPVSDDVKKRTRRAIDRGMQALDRILVADPYAAGDVPTLADFYIFYTFQLVSLSTTKIYGQDIVQDYPRLAALITRLADHPSIKREMTEHAAE